MNRTLKNVKTIMEQAAADRHRAEQQRLSELQRLADVATPLFEAFTELEDQYLRVSALQQIWPEDFGTRGDRLSGVLLGYTAERGVKYGLSFRVPGGQMRFSPELQPNGELIFVATRDGGNARPMVREFVNRDDWLDYFLRTISGMIEILE